MKKMWKNVLGIVLVAAISAGAAVGTSAYLINKNQPVFWHFRLSKYLQPADPVSRL